MKFGLNADQVVVFAPFAGITTHSVVERALAQQLGLHGADVVLITCSGQFRSRCVFMESKSMAVPATEAERQNACLKCSTRRQEIHGRPQNYRTVDLQDLVEASDSHLSAQILDAFRSNPSTDFEWDGYPLGAFWSYETVLRFKSAARTDEFNAHLAEIAESGVVAFALAQRLATASDSAIKSVLVHSVEYGINRSFIAPFVSEGTPCFTFANAGLLSAWTAGVNVQNININVAWDHATLRENRVRAFDGGEISISEGAMVRTWLDERINPTSALVYSASRGSMSASSVRAELGLELRPTVVAFGSSPDERWAANIARLVTEPNDEGDQYTFLRRVMQLAEAMPHANFVYRIHPRLAPNRRDAQLSPHFDRLIAAADGPDNFFLNLPSQGLGVYDVVMVADVALNWNSSTGLEFMLCGVPVLAFEDAPVIRPDGVQFGRLPESLPDQVLAVENALAGGWSEDHVRQAARWVVATAGRTVIPVAQSRQVGSWVRRRIFSAKALWAALDNRASDRGSDADRVGDWRELINDWVNWSHVPSESSARGEEDAIGDLCARIVEVLAPWDGTEGAMQGLHRGVTQKESLK
jgi:hypothetical protein